MKKKIFRMTIVVAIAIVAGWNYQQGKDEVKLSDLALANVEALATGEAGPDWGHTKLVYKPNACCEDNPYHSCSGIYSPC